MGLYRLMLEDGSLLALAAEDRDKARNVAAIVSNIWCHPIQARICPFPDCLLRHQVILRTRVGGRAGVLTVG